MRFVIIFFLCLNQQLGYAQLSRQYQPIPITDTIPADIYNSLKRQADADKAAVVLKGKTGTFLKSLYDKRLDYQVGMFNRDYILMNDHISDFLDQIQSKIYQANPDLAPETTIYPYRSEVPNALSMGNGTLCLMLGLLARLETEDQVAFVLCHELAHHHRRHTDKRMTELANANYDKELKKKIDAIMANPYNRYSQLKSLFNSLEMSFSKHSRFAEYEADSVGLVYYLRTGYNPLAPLRVMQILGQADRSNYTSNIDLKKVFNFPELPFKDSWLDYKKSEMWHAPPELSDSDTTSTHPNCDKRFATLKLLLGLDSISPEQIKAGKSIDELRMHATFEVINSQYHFRQYGKSLFNALALSELYPDNVFLHAMIGKNLYKIYQAQKNHELGKVLELPDPRFPENYDRFLTFMHKLRLAEIAGLAYNYVTTRPEAFYTNEEFIHALWLCSRFEFSKVDPEKVRMEYDALYPDGKYSKEMKNY
jgi:Zn-dependent protease with chaperone function